jgi:hypothetical protein
MEMSRRLDADAFVSPSGTGSAHLPLVSIVVNNFNYARFLVQTIDSALAQSYARVEVLVVDDASTDGSRAIIESYGDRIVPVFQAVNQGQGAAFNAGFRASRGDIVMFLDADDWLYPEAARRVVETWVAGESKTHFRLDLVDIDGAHVDVHPPREVRLDGGDVLPLLFEFGRYETPVTTGNAFARGALELVMPMPAEFRLGADGYLAIVVPFHGQVVSVDECLGAYRMHGANAYAGSATAESIESFFRRARRRLAHDEDRDRVLQAKAATVGRRLGPRSYMRDPMHLELRLGSLRMGPDTHPYPSDNRVLLALRGIAASRRARLSWSRRVLTAAWFLIAGCFPLSLASRAICWRLMPANRPAPVNRGLKWIRRVLH